MQKFEHQKYITDLAHQLRRRQTPAEAALWTCLRNRKLRGAKFRRQQPLGRYIPDFYCHEVGLAVELEGSVHDQADQQEYDAVRREAIERLGVRLLVFKNEEVTQNLGSVLFQIAGALSNSPLTPNSSPTWRALG